MCSKTSSVVAKGNHAVLIGLNARFDSNGYTAFAIEQRSVWLGNDLYGAN